MLFVGDGAVCATAGGHTGPPLHLPPTCCRASFLRRDFFRTS